MVQVKKLTIGTGRPKICVPMTGETREELLREAILAKEAGADLVEWRVDCYKEVFQQDQVIETLVLIQEMLDGLPLLFTFRTVEEGGKQDISIREYHDLYQAIIRLKQVLNQPSLPWDIPAPSAHRQNVCPPSFQSCFPLLCHCFWHYNAQVQRWIQFRQQA